MHRGYSWLCLLVGLVPCAVTPAFGQTIINWNNPAGGNYQASGNWNAANVSNTATETARFDLAATFETSFNANSSTHIDDLLIELGDVTFLNAGVSSDATLNIIDDAIIDGGTLTLARTASNAEVDLSIADRLYVGASGTGTLNIEDGGVMANAIGILADDYGSTGTATVTGGGSQWNNSSDLYVGDSGAATLNVAAGGTVEVGTSTSPANVSLGTNVTGDGARTFDEGGFLLLHGGHQPRRGHLGVQLQWRAAQRGR